MSQIIFSNSRSLHKRDIYNRILLAIGIILFVLLLSPLRNHAREFSWYSITIVGSFILVAWTIDALREKTLKAVEINSGSQKVFFILEKQFGKIEIISFDINSINYQIKKQSDRFISQKYVLLIRDEKNRLAISSRYKGLSIEC
ncbi:hypothetical protein [Chryseolinea sp. H1M3-3]|uniref:hypothetical protein n=1 Tax=Chryseolinea sp. H1M3-3 TaxID=3034144 RepID=UPI0023ED09C8|nr:hypothetical protein [Chryseolinea sp. H1M3-3]